MIGAIVYRLRAENSARLPIFHGRLVHGAIFSLLRDHSEALAKFVHEKMNSKPFTVSALARISDSSHSGRKNMRENDFAVKEGELYYLRLTALHDEVLAAFLQPQPDMELQIGRARFALEEVLADGRQETGLAAVEELIEGAASLPEMESIEFSFLSPVSFRNFDRDYPFPLPELIFGSLADKWLQAGLPELFDRQSVKEAARELQPGIWQGRSRRVYFASDRGMLAFSGRFSYLLAGIEPEWQRIFLMLAQFAVFAGVGRLTAQGFGQTRIECRPSGS